MRVNNVTAVTAVFDNNRNSRPNALTARLRKYPFFVLFFVTPTQNYKSQTFITHYLDD